MVRVPEVFFLVIALAFVVFPLSLNQLTSAQMPDVKCANLDARPLYLSYNITQIESQPGDSDHTMMTISLRENNTGRTIDAATFFITINDTENEMSIVDVFHAENGILRLDFVHGGIGPIQIFGTREQFLNAWRADPGGNITIRNLPFEADKMFHVSVEVLSIDNIRNICDEGEIQPVDFIFDGSSNAARNVQIVSEFGSIAIFLITTAIGAVIAASRTRLK